MYKYWCGGKEFVDGCVEREVGSSGKWQFI